MPLKDDVLALAKLKRSRPNLEKIQGQLEELRGFADDADTAITALADMRESVADGNSNLDGMDEGNPLTPWLADVIAASDAFLQALPDESADSVEEQISEAETLAEEYEECLEDSDLTADDREEIWGNLLDALSNIAEAMQ